MQLDLWATWTSSPAAGRARETVSQESAAASRMTEATSGGSSSESSRSRAPRTSSRKTSGALFPSTLDAISELSSVPWMTRGTMLGGSLLPLPPAAPRTSVSDSGFSLGAERWATQRAEDSQSSGERKGRGVADTMTSQARAATWPTPTLDDVNNATRDSGSFQSLTRAAVNQPWPTPASTMMNDAESPEEFSARARRWKEEKGYHNSVPLCVAVKEWSTPTVNDSKNSTSPPSQKERDSLSQNVMWQTPVSHDCKVSTGPQAEMNRDSIVRDVMWATPCAVVAKESPFQQQETITKQAVPAIRGDRPRLNAAWVEQIMGWPTGWVTGLPAEVFGRLEEERRNTRGKRRASSKSAPKATSRP